MGIKQFDQLKKIVVLGGKTGSGKTEVLHHLSEMGEQILDLEYYANHKGSAFGALGQKPQPSNEYFENQLAGLWSNFDPNKVIWIESESLQIGKNILPQRLFQYMRSTLVVEMQLGQELRAERILKEYGGFSKEELEENTLKVSKRLGHQKTTEAINHLRAGEMNSWVMILLDYYDKLYHHSVTTRVPWTVFPIELSTGNALSNANSILQFAKEKVFTQLEKRELIR